MVVMLVKQVSVILIISCGLINRQSILLLNQLLCSIFYRTTGHAKLGFIFTYFLVFFCVAPPIARGAEWSAEPYVRLKSGYNDNVRLVLADQKTTKIETTVAGIGLRVREDRWDIVVKGRYSHINYTPNDNRDSNNTLHRLNSSYKTERAVWSLAGSIRDESVLVSETIDVDTGLVQFQRQRIKKDIAPSVSWILSEKIQAKWSIQYTDVSYDDNTDAGNLFDYENIANTFFISYGITERSQLLAQLSSSGFRSQRTEPDDLAIDEWRSTESITRNYLLGMGYDLNEMTNFQLLVGTRKTITDTTFYSCTVFLGLTCLSASNVVFPAEEIGFTYTGALKRKLESGNIKIDFGRAISPSSGGTEVVNDNISLQIDRSLTEKWSSALSISHLEARTIGEDLNGNDRRIVQIEPKVTWYQNANQSGWSGSLFYRYTRLRRVYESRAVTRNILNLAIRYGWSKIDLL